MPAQRKKIDPTRRDFGAVLGRYLHWAEISGRDLAKKIGSSPPVISEIIHKPKKSPASQTWIHDRNMLDVLRTLNPTIFKSMETDFTESIANLPETITRGCYSRRHIGDNDNTKLLYHWRRSLQLFVKNALEFSGDTIKDIIADAPQTKDGKMDKFFHAERNWMCAISDRRYNPNLTENRLKTTFRIICELYEVDEDHPLYPAYARAMYHFERGEPYKTKPFEPT